MYHLDASFMLFGILMKFYFKSRPNFPLSDGRLPIALHLEGIEVTFSQNMITECLSIA